MSSTVHLHRRAGLSIAYLADRGASTTLSVLAAVALLFMFGMGMGRGNPSLRYIRIGLLVMVILAGVVFHHSGGVYNTIHAIYYVLIVGFLVFAIVTRRRAGQSRGGTAGGSWGGRTSGGSWGGGSAGGSWGNTPPPTQPPASSDPSGGVVNNEHNPGPNVPPPDPPTN